MIRSIKETTPLFSTNQLGAVDSELLPLDDSGIYKKPNSLSQRISISAPVLEFLGTFILVFAICTTYVTLENNILSTAIAIGGTIVLLVYMAGHISGAHFNPAVSLCMFLRGKLSLLSLLLYVVVQLFGSLLGAVFAFAVTEKRLLELDRPPFCPHVSSHIHYLPAFLCEALWTGLLCFVSLVVATTKSQEKNNYYGIAIGSTIATGILVLAPLTGAVFNPGVATGTCIANSMLTSNFQSLSDMWIYWGSGLFGACGATIIYLLTNIEELKMYWNEFSWQNMLL